MTDVLTIDIFLDECNLQESAIKIIRIIRPEWNSNNLAFKVFTDGITNKLIGCWTTDDPSDVILTRIYGKNTNLLVDREEEKSNFYLLHKAGFAPKIYATFTNGLAYAFVPGDTVTTVTVKDISVYPLIAVNMARMHSIHLEREKSPIIWAKTKKFLKLVPKTYTSNKTQELYKQRFPDGTTTLDCELDTLMNLLSNDENPIVFCHNDLLLPNIIYKDNKVTFIDYEYAGLNYQAFDIGNHFAEFAGVTDVDYSLYPDRDFQYNWLKIYLDEFNRSNNLMKIITDNEIHKLYLQVNKFALVSHLFWAAWALVQAQHSTINFNFMEYAILRMKEYNAKKTTLLNLT